MDTVLQLQQPNGYNFRAEVFAFDKKLLLWVAENDENIYALTMLKIIKVDLYKPLYEADEEDEVMAIILYLDEQNKVQSVEVGNFTSQDAAKFVVWLQGFANYINNSVAQ